MLFQNGVSINNGAASDNPVFNFKRLKSAIPSAFAAHRWSGAMQKNETPAGYWGMFSKSVWTYQRRRRARQVAHGETVGLAVNINQAPAGGGKKTALKRFFRPGPGL